MLAYLVLSIALTAWLVIAQDAPLAFALLIFGWGGAVALVRLVALIVSWGTTRR
ncbi:hypothetical protein [Micromonospora avicenniae]|uniref:hypothetical protein n=1 Tax=Micromonospora avicenniae TaxID=1198245 RepID=UPI00343DD0F4